MFEPFKFHCMNNLNSIVVTTVFQTYHRGQLSHNIVSLQVPHVDQYLLVYSYFCQKCTTALLRSDIRREYSQRKYSNTVLSGHSLIGKTKVLKTNGSLLKVESIAECSPWSILQYF